jgi:hypothetical protein
MASFASAQQPEKIYGKNRVLKSNDYYLEQKKLWKKETDKDPKNADAWYNYYRADRNSYIVGEETDSLNTKGINRFERLKKTVSEMGKQVPESYEYNYVKWLNGNNDLSLFPYLEKAHLRAPEKSEPLMSLIYYYEIKGDNAKRDVSAQAAYNTGEFSPGLLNYGYNLLAGLEKNAIVFTEGDKDTDAIFLLQQGKGIRKDVRLINLNLLLIKEYRERILKELQVPEWNVDPLANTETYATYQQSIIEQFAKNKTRRPVAVAVTVSTPYTKTIKEKLCLTGLAFEYSPIKTNELKSLKRNLEELYLLDYLTVYLPHDISVEMMHRFNENYLPALKLLQEHYQAAGNTEKAKHYQDLGLQIIKDSPDKR